MQMAAGVEQREVRMEKAKMSPRVQKIYEHFYDRYDREMISERNRVYAQIKEKY